MDVSCPYKCCASEIFQVWTSYLICMLQFKRRSAGSLYLKLSKVGDIYICKEHDLGKVNILMENRIIAIWHKMHARLLFLYAIALNSTGQKSM